MLKEMELVVGVKRLRESGSDLSHEDLTSLGSSISMNRNMEYTLADMDDLITSIDSHRSSVISGLRMRIMELGIESGSENPYDSDNTDSSSESEVESEGRAVLVGVEPRLIQSQAYGDDVVEVYEDGDSRGPFSTEK